MEHIARNPGDQAAHDALTDYFLEHNDPLHKVVRRALAYKRHPAYHTGDATHVENMPGYHTIAEGPNGVHVGRSFVTTDPEVIHNDDGNDETEEGPIRAFPTVGLYGHGANIEAPVTTAELREIEAHHYTDLLPTSQRRDTHYALHGQNRPRQLVDPREEGVQMARTDEPEILAPDAATVYASPSERVNSTLEQAVNAFHNADHHRLLLLAKRLPNAKDVVPSMGVWADGAEEGVRTEVEPDARAIKAAALLGLKGKQKQVLLWQTRKDGPHFRYRLEYPPRGIAQVIGAFRDAGVPYATHLPEPNKNGAIGNSEVVDFDGSQADKVADVAARLGAKVELERGTGDSLGHETDRNAARKIFQKILSRP